ncbi:MULTISPECIES: acyl-CoA dehydrogenase family protein [Sphingobium]|jgi:alkylation response protein AidB-like acyl-CoA dehydrogenase|uniref:Butyryl-CoA dehydrogenase n=1 Tax=Sphingobium fuliginis (strain ATCC 27551) TaxID=336203 RepID=A0A292ZB43_SPHSA|nr:MULTISPECIES: acyl-CoA dehydrogenase family protein [Sphingobium]WDA39234.1 acyl-CoA dehydrogenase family protein [Sphingobium sp. YC-XJ3]GAY19985.1 butyryl-CoA dehydrogenase [Sphingobium fuliginis]
MADNASLDLEQFRHEVRLFLDANCPPSMRDRGAPPLEGPPDTSEDCRTWTRILGEKGWGVPTLPSEYGGANLTPEQATVIEEEMHRIGSFNPIAGVGVNMLAPTLLEFGTEEQKAMYLPSIAKHETLWCQGFSEPSAGSDLASLRMRAEDKGDHFLVTGQKVWTSGAAWADMCFCLVRTDQSRKQGGISFLLIDMRSPGVELKPIKLISGSSPFSELFLTDVKVPKSNLVGEINKGWNVAKRLLQFERDHDYSGAFFGMYGIDDSSVSVARQYLDTDDDGRLVRGELRDRVIRNEMDYLAYYVTRARIKADPEATLATSILKNIGTRIGQEKAELIAEIMGFKSLGWDEPGFEPYELEKTRGWLAGKASTIFGGTYEIQNNVIAKRILGLPDSAG